MTESANVEIVKRGYEAFGRGDVAALVALFDENISWVTPGPSDLPTSGTRRGRQEVAGFFQALNEHFQVDRFEPREFIAQGDRVVVTGDESARLRSTGTSIEVQWAHVFGLRNGLIVSFHEYFDTHAAVDAMREATAAARV